MLTRTALIAALFAACAGDPPPCGDAAEAYYGTGCVVPAFEEDVDGMTGWGQASVVGRCKKAEEDGATAECQAAALDLRECLADEDGFDDGGCGCRAEMMALAGC